MSTVIKHHRDGATIQSKNYENYSIPHHQLKLNNNNHLVFF